MRTKNECKCAHEKGQRLMHVLELIRLLELEEVNRILIVAETQCIRVYVMQLNIANVMHCTHTHSSVEREALTVSARRRVTRSTCSILHELRKYSAICIFRARETGLIQSAGRECVCAFDRYV